MPHLEANITDVKDVRMDESALGTKVS